MVSKLQQHEDIGKYLLQSGLQENLLHCGFIATIIAVEKRNVEVVLPCGETRRIWYQIELPSSRADGLLQRWRKCFMKAQKQSAWIRFLGCQWCDAPSVLQKNYWAMKIQSCWSSAASWIKGILGFLMHIVVLWVVGPDPQVGSMIMVLVCQL